MENEDADLVFVIDGKEYVSPALDGLNMGERRVLYELAGIVQEDFVREPDETDDEHQERVRKLTRHPGFLEALMHIAFARGNPSLKREKIQAVIEQTNFLEAIEKWGADNPAEEDDGVPPVLTTEPEPSSSNGSVENESTKQPLSVVPGSSSGNGSDEPADNPSPTGGSRSDMSPTSALAT